MKYIYFKYTLILLIAASFTLSAKAQQLRTSYFMDKSIVRTSLNPAFRPERGYVSIPVVGSLGATYTSNGVAVNDLFYPKGGKLVTFLDGSVETNAFLKRLKKNNQFNVDFNTSILSAGWYAGKGFWSADISVKGNTSVRIPKTLFDFMKKGTGLEGETYDIRNINAYIDSYIEAAVGYSRPINKRLTVGGKFKLLLGAANMDASIDHLHAEMYDTSWKITSTGKLNATMKGLSPTMETDNKGKEYINDFDFDTPGIGGFGTAVDLGASYKLLDNLTVSAALLDLGFINWSAGNTTAGAINGEEFNFNGFDLAIGENKDEIPSMSDQFEDLKDDINNLFHFKETNAKGRTTMLRATLNLGAEYSILQNKLGFGLLSSTRFYRPKAYTEMTVSANYRPLDWLSASLSYSFIHSDFKTFGWALNFSPSWIHFFIGSDYMFTKVTPQYVPISASAMNAYIGISVPLARGCCR